MIRRSMMHTSQCGASDEEIINEELSADIDGNDGWRRRQVGRNDWLARHVLDAWRPSAARRIPL